MTMPKQCSHRPPTQDKNDLKALYDIGFHSGPFSRSPVHENITIAALIRSNVTEFPKDSTYATLTEKQWEFIRGLVWNDDPSCLLFVDDATTNHKWGWGLEWLRAYEDSSGKSMTRRSHWGDLQFLHCMAGEDGEGPWLTRLNIMSWFEVMYKLACGHISAKTKLGRAFPLLFDDSTVPSGDATLDDLLIATTKRYEDFNLHHRAIGSCVHMIQDSYAIGHTQRRLLNPEDKVDDDSQGFIEFKPGTYGQYGPILCFHNYASQTGDGHTHYDSMEGAQPDPDKLNSFNQINGARNAIGHCSKILDFFAAGIRWEDGVREYLRQEVFVLDEDVRRSDGSTKPDEGSDHENDPDSKINAASVLSEKAKQPNRTSSQPHQIVDLSDNQTTFEKLPLLESASGQTDSPVATRNSRTPIFAIILLLYSIRIWLWYIEDSST
ncbi:hypothetical protein MRB53_040997 [Persea americana]|nr:hypothetical protein MRB53_040997 [Persea americana]